MELYDREDKTKYNFFINQYEKLIDLEPNNSMWYFRFGEYVFQQILNSNSFSGKFILFYLALIS